MARDRQAYVESKIRELEKTLDNVELIEDNNVDIKRCVLKQQ